jgi:hypothetical protein
MSGFQENEEFFQKSGRVVILRFLAPNITHNFRMIHRAVPEILCDKEWTQNGQT